MPNTVSISPGEAEFFDGNLPNGHFWRVKFTDIETADVAILTFSDAALIQFVDQLNAIRQSLRN